MSLQPYTLKKIVLICLFICILGFICEINPKKSVYSHIRVSRFTWSSKCFFANFCTNKVTREGVEFVLYAENNLSYMRK